MTPLLALFLFELAADGYLTFHVLRFGGREVIPWLAWLIARIGKYPALLIAKLIPAAVVLYLYRYGFNGTELDQTTMAWICGGYALVIVNNYHVLLDIQQK
jgi:hypothetical protein